MWECPFDFTRNTPTSSYLIRRKFRLLKHFLDINQHENKQCGLIWITEIRILWKPIMFTNCVQTISKLFTFTVYSCLQFCTCLPKHIQFTSFSDKHICKGKLLKCQTTTKKNDTKFLTIAKQIYLLYWAITIIILTFRMNLHISYWLW